MGRNLVSMFLTTGYMTWVSCSLGYKRTCVYVHVTMYTPPWVMTSTYIEVEWYRVTPNLLQFVEDFFSQGHSHRAVCANVTQIGYTDTMLMKKESKEKSNKISCQTAALSPSNKECTFSIKPSSNSTDNLSA